MPTDRGPRETGSQTASHREQELQRERVAGLERAQDEASRERERLQGMLARYRGLFDATPVACLALNPSGAIVACNRLAAGLIGHTGDALIGRLLRDFFDPDSYGALSQHLRTGHGIDDLRCSEGVLVDARGERLPVEIRSQTGAAGRDLLAISLIVPGAQGATTEAADARGRERFLAVLSHELRTPLTPIANLIAVLQRRRDLPDDTRPILEMMERNLWKEVRLVERLLDTTRIMGNRLQLARREIDLHQPLREAVGMLTDRFREAHVGLDTSLAAEDSLASADPDRILQVFWNLIGNSVRFTPAGGHVRLSTSNPAPGRIRIRVDDDGAGIEPHRIGSLFDPFERSTDHDHGGLGLGLPLARGVVEAHGGDIEVRSDGPNRGASFIVTLPTLREPPDLR